MELKGKDLDFHVFSRKSCDGDHKENKLKSSIYVFLIEKHCFARLLCGQKPRQVTFTWKNGVSPIGPYGDLTKCLPEVTIDTEVVEASFFNEKCINLRFETVFTVCSHHRTLIFVKNIKNWIIFPLFRPSPSRTRIGTSGRTYKIILS